MHHVDNWSIGLISMWASMSKHAFYVVLFQIRNSSWEQASSDYITNSCKRRRRMKIKGQLSEEGNDINDMQRFISF